MNRGLSIIFLLLVAVPALAQDLEPRSFSQAPVDMNFAALTYAHATGEVLFDYGDERLGPPMKAIVDACHEAGKLVGLPAIVPDHIGPLVEMGVDWIQVGNDVAWITAAARQTVTSARESIGAASG